MSAWARKKKENKEKEDQKKYEESVASEKLPIYATKGATYSEVTVEGGLKVKSYTSPITPNTAFHIRNRMMSKMGAKVHTQRLSLSLSVCML